MIHDKFCPHFGIIIDGECFYCTALAKARADEREQAAQRILAIDDEENNDYWRDGVHEALAAARGEDTTNE